MYDQRIIPNFGPTTGLNVVRILVETCHTIKDIKFDGTSVIFFHVLSPTEVIVLVPPSQVAKVINVALVYKRTCETLCATYSYVAGTAANVNTPMWTGVVPEIDPTRMIFLPRLNPLTIVRPLASGDSPSQLIYFTTGNNIISNRIDLEHDAITAALVPTGHVVYVPLQFNPTVEVLTVPQGNLIASPTLTDASYVFDMVILPNGKFGYITSFNTGKVLVINIPDNTIVTQISLGVSAASISATPDSKTVYVSNFVGNTIIPIDTATNTTRTPIIVGFGNGMISITPDGTLGYASASFSNKITVFSIPSENIISTITFPPGSLPYGSTILPNGKVLYSINQGGSVTVIAIPSNVVAATIPFPAGSNPFWAAATPDSKNVYVINSGLPYMITSISTATNTIVATIVLDRQPQNIEITPDLAPIANFRFLALCHSHVLFDASLSRSPVGTIVSYTWNFGDGTPTVTTNIALIKHKYACPGNFLVTLTVVNSNGTSNNRVWSSRFFSTLGGPSAALSRMISTIKKKLCNHLPHIIFT